LLECRKQALGMLLTRGSPRKRESISRREE
jgi:hypothetical protein